MACLVEAEMSKMNTGLPCGAEAAQTKCINFPGSMLQLHVQAFRELGDIWSEDDNMRASGSDKNSSATPPVEEEVRNRLVCTTGALEHAEMFSTIPFR
eukprot:1161590-Pelagomonas_calceolata.AAC.15